MNAQYGSLFHVIKNMNNHEAMNLEREDYLMHRMNISEDDAAKEQRAKRIRKRIEEDKLKELLERLITSDDFF